MRLLHTSDWHIGRQFHNVSLLEDQRYVLDQIVAMVREQRVDGVLIAGDIYDRSVPPAAAVELLDEVLNRICRELGVPVVMISGNHDSAERLGFGARQLADGGLHIISSLDQLTEPVVLESGGEQLACYGIPYADPATVRNHFQLSVSGHDEAMAELCGRIGSYHRERFGEQVPSVVLSHCFIDGGEESESERPLSLGGADRVSADHFRNFSYAALGHLHGRQFKGRESIRYSGSILKYSFSEQHQHKSVVLVDIDRQGVSRSEPLSLMPLRDMRIIEGSLQQLLEQGANDPGREDYLLVRLSDSQAILDVMGKLREVYPNVLHLERPGLMAAGELRQLHRDQLKKSELAMFRDFFKQVGGEPMDEQQSQLVTEVLEEIHNEEQH